MFSFIFDRKPEPPRSEAYKQASREVNNDTAERLRKATGWLLFLPTPEKGE